MKGNTWKATYDGNEFSLGGDELPGYAGFYREEIKRISMLGDGKDLDSLYSGIDLETKPILERLVEGGVEALYHWATETYDYKEKNSGYIAKCHFCLDIRQHLVQTGNRFAELSPKSFYENLE